MQAVRDKCGSEGPEVKDGGKKASLVLLEKGRPGRSDVIGLDYLFLLFFFWKEK